MAVKNSKKVNTKKAPKSKAKAKNKPNTKKPAPKKPVNKTALIVGICICLVVAVGISAFSLFNRSEKVGQAIELYQFDSDVAAGVDLSEHNGKVDFKALKKDADFVFIRVGYRGYGNGKIVEDKRAKKNIKGCEEAGIPYGVYFYSQAVNEKEAKQEADFTLNMIKHHSPELPVVIDFEYATNSNGRLDGRLFNKNLTREEKTKLISAFCQRARDKGYIGGVYASSSVLANEINTKKLDKDTFIWVADYNENVTYSVPYTAWQYSRKGKLKAVSSKYVDLNYWYKNR